MGNCRDKSDKDDIRISPNLSQISKTRLLGSAISRQTIVGLQIDDLPPGRRPMGLAPTNPPMKVIAPDFAVQLKDLRVNVDCPSESKLQDIEDAFLQGSSVLFISPDVRANCKKPNGLNPMKRIIYACMMILTLDTLTLSSSAPLDSESISVEDLLQRSLGTVMKRHPMMADVEIHSKYTDGHESKRTSRVYMRGEQHDCIREMRRLEDGKWVKWSEIRGIWDGSGYILRQQRRSHFNVTYNDTPSSAERGMGGAYGLSGRLLGKHFAELLQESKTLRVRPGIEHVNGFACYVVEGDTPDGHYTVWLDPQNGCLLRRIIREGVMDLSDLPPEAPRPVKSRTEVRDVKIEVVGGIPVVTEATRHGVYELDDGTVGDDTFHEKMSNVVWNPDFESMGAFKMDKIPDGTPVIYKASGLPTTGVKFRWVDGRVVTTVDDEALGSTRSSLTASQERIIHFPQDRSIGELSVRDSDVPTDSLDAVSGWEWLGQARGNVTVPAGKAVRLNVSKQAWEGGRPFEGLKPDDIQMLSFSKYRDADDSVLEDVSSLADLQLLGLAGTQMLGTGLKHLVQLRNLKWLGLASTHVGDNELACLAESPALESLSLRYTPVSNAGMVHVGKIRALKFIDLSGTSVDDDGLGHLKNLTSLRRLWFSRNYVTDEGLRHLAGLTEMEELIFSGTRISGGGLLHLGRMQKLKNLRLGSTKVADEGLEHLRQIESLQYLELPSDTNITDAGLAQLSESNSLKHLYVISNSITDKGLETLAKLKSLEQLDTGGQNIDDDCMAKIARFPALKGLWIQACPVTNAGLAELKNLESLTELDIENVPITGEGLAVLREFPSLIRLSLLRLNLGEAGLSGLAGLTSLESLRIYYTRVNDEDLASLSALSHLKRLIVDSKGTTDVGMVHLAELKSLETLQLRGSGITDAGLVHLEGLDQLKYLSLRGTKVTKEGLAQLKKKIPALSYQL